MFLLLSESFCTNVWSNKSFILFSSVDQPLPQPQKILINPHFQGTIRAQPDILLKEAQVRQQVNDSHFLLEITVKLYLHLHCVRLLLALL